MRKFFKKVAAVAVLIVVAVISFFFKGFSFGGDGSGNGDGKSAETLHLVDDLFEPEEPPEESEEAIQNTEGQKDKTDMKDQADETGKLPKVIIVTIQKDKVFVGEKEFADAKALKQYIEEINSDEREFKLKDENSILDTYEWVTEVFEDMKVQLVPIED